jgi:MFS family permease
MSKNTHGYPTSLAAWTTVAILMVAYMLSFIDRQILSLLVEPIRRDLAINDTQMSLLMGLSFAIFYTLCGIPLGRLADTKSRRGLIMFGVMFWSAATAACGMAKLYWQFLLCRIGVGMGEAALSPAAYSLIADSFPPERRATAISVYAMGIYLGSGVAFLLGGLVIHLSSAPLAFCSAWWCVPSRNPCAVALAQAWRCPSAQWPRICAPTVAPCYATTSASPPWPSPATEARPGYRRFLSAPSAGMPARSALFTAAPWPSAVAWVSSSAGVWPTG